MKTALNELLDEVAFEHSMNQYAVEGAANLLRMIIREADEEMLKQEPFDCLEGVWSLLDKTERDMTITEKKLETRFKLLTEDNAQ